MDTWKSFEADDGLALPNSDETVVCLIMHECVLNAFQHAFPDGRRGKNQGQLSKQTGSAVRLPIEDDGALRQLRADQELPTLSLLKTVFRQSCS